MCISAPFETLLDLNLEAAQTPNYSNSWFEESPAPNMCVRCAYDNDNCIDPMHTYIPLNE